MIKNNKNTQVQETTTGDFNNVTYLEPDVDIIENDSEFAIYLDMAGTDKEHIEIKLEENILFVKSKVEAPDNHGLKLVYTEFQTEGYSRKFSLSNNVNVKKIDAHLEDGVLTLTLQKKAKENIKTIKVT